MEQNCSAQSPNLLTLRSRSLYYFMRNISKLREIDLKTKGSTFRPYF